MKRFFIYTIVGASTLCLAFSPNLAAQDAQDQTQSTVIDNVIARCDEIQGSLRRLHTSDALLRVNIGQTYNSISARLMARLNSRLAINRIDSRELVEVSGSFDQLRLDFGANYSEYESALSSLLKIDCKSKPAEFYAKLLTTRDLRLKLAETVKSMNQGITDYRVGVERIKLQMSGSENERTN